MWFFCEVLVYLGRRLDSEARCVRALQARQTEDCLYKTTITECLRGAKFYISALLSKINKG